MIGLLVELAISWLLLYLIYRSNLGVLGIKPTGRRLLQLVFGLLIAATCSSLYLMMTNALAHNSWTVNPKMTPALIWKLSMYTIISVLYEELIFRGALLYIAIKKLGAAKACILSSVCFGIYHWFTFGVLGNPFMMMIIFLMTAFVGLSWAFAYARTGSMYLPIGLHMGWNFIQAVVFESGNGDQRILVTANDNYLAGTLSLLMFLFQVLALPICTFLYLRWLTKKQKPIGVEAPEALTKHSIQ